MTVADLLKQLEGLPLDRQVRIRVSVMNCSGHGPDEYCYCSEEDKFFSGIYPQVDTHEEASTSRWNYRKPKLLKEPVVTLVGS